MGGIFNFAGPEGHLPHVRNIDNDAPQPMRQQILAVAYDLLPEAHAAFTEQQLYYGIEQMLGEQAAGAPMAGWRQRLGRDLGNAQWPQVYDVVCWLWGQFQRGGLHELFRQNVNEVFAANAVAWDLGADGRMHRFLPGPAQEQVEAAIQELANPAYAAALLLFNAARDAYDGQPRRDRDACMNAFQAVESVAQIHFNMPARAFNDLLADLRRRRVMNAQIIDLLDQLNVLRHRTFGHVMANEFALAPVEVDFVYLTCIAAVLLVTRTP